MRKNQAPEGWLSFIRILARDAKVNVVIGDGVGPATDKKTIWLSALPLELTPDDLVLFKGDAFHETGHCRHTNIPYFQAFSKANGKFAQFLLNALDDVFMEGRMASWKQMAARYLRDSTNVLIKRGSFRDGSVSLGEAVACYCLSYLTAKRWPEIGAITVRVEANLRKHLAQHADKVMGPLTALLDAEFPSVRSTEDGGALALKIIELMRELSEEDDTDDESTPNNGGGNPKDGQDPAESDPEQPEEPDGSKGSDPKPEGEGGEQGDGDEDAGGGADDNNDQAEPKQAGKCGQGDEDESPNQSDEPKPGQTGNESKGNKTGKGNPQAGQSAEGDEAGNGDANAGGSATDKTEKTLKELVDAMLKEDLGSQEIFDKGEAVKALSEAIAKGKAEEYKGQPLVGPMVIDGDAGAGASKDFVDGMPVVQGDKVMAEVIKATVGRKANVAANRLRALLANREETESFSSRTGRLSDKHLHRFALDDTRIFEKSEERVEDTAAVSVTADLSGSTQNGIAEQIRMALTLLEKVLNEIGTPREILGFSPKTGELNCLVKAFSDNHRVALDRIAGMHRLVGGDHTPIGSAVLQAGARLMSFDAQRKLMFVVTDGIPSDSETAIEMTKYVTRNGVNVIYLVIGEESSCEWLKNNGFKYAHASKAEELIPALVSKVGEFLA